MNHKAIYRVHSQVVRIDDLLGAFDANGNPVELDIEAIKKASIEIEREETEKIEQIKNKRQAALTKLESLGLDLEDLRALGLG